MFQRQVFHTYYYRGLHEYSIFSLDSSILNSTSSFQAQYFTIMAEKNSKPASCKYRACIASGCIFLLSAIAFTVMFFVDPHRELKPKVIEVFQRKRHGDRQAGVFCWGAVSESSSRPTVGYGSGKTQSQANADAKRDLEKKQHKWSSAVGRSTSTSADDWNDVWGEYGSNIVRKCEEWKKQEAKGFVQEEEKKVQNHDEDSENDEFEFPATSFTKIFEEYSEADQKLILQDCADFVERKAEYDEKAFGFTVYVIVALAGICALYCCYQFRKCYKEELEQQMFDESDSDLDDFDAPDPVPVHFQPAQWPQTGDQVQNLTNLQNPHLQNQPPVQPPAPLPVQTSAPSPKPSEGGAVLV